MMQLCVDNGVNSVSVCADNEPPRPPQPLVTAGGSDDVWKLIRV